MGQISLQTDFYRHPIILSVGPRASLLYVAGMCYCSRHQTTDAIPTEGLVELAQDVQTRHLQPLIDRLVTAGLWETTPTGYRIADWLKCRIVYGKASPARRLWDQLRRRISPLVLARDGYRCQYCGALQDLTVDHVLPLSRGGSNALENLTTACMPCNSAKRAKTLEEWRA